MPRVQIYSAAHGLAALQLHTASEIVKLIDDVAARAARDGFDGPRPMPFRGGFSKQLEHAAARACHHIAVADLEADWWREIIAACQRIIVPQRASIEALLNTPIHPRERGAPVFSTSLPFVDLMTLLKPQTVPAAVGESEEQPEQSLPQKG